MVKPLSKTDALLVALARGACSLVVLTRSNLRGRCIKPCCEYGAVSFRCILKYDSDGAGKSIELTGTGTEYSDLLDEFGGMFACSVSYR